MAGNPHSGFATNVELGADFQPVTKELPPRSDSLYVSSSPSGFKIGDFFADALLLFFPFTLLTMLFRYFLLGGGWKSYLYLLVTFLVAFLLGAATPRCRLVFSLWIPAIFSTPVVYASYRLLLLSIQLPGEGADGLLSRVFIIVLFPLLSLIAVWSLCEGCQVDEQEQTSLYLESVLLGAALALLVGWLAPQEWIQIVHVWMHDVPTKS